MIPLPLIQGCIECAAIGQENCSEHCDQPSRPDRDGCDCPECVVRCVHLEGHPTLALTIATPKQLLHLKCNPKPMDPYNVGFFSGVYTCKCGADRATNPGPDYPAPRQFQNEAEALEAFHAAEARLLGRDA